MKHLEWFFFAIFLMVQYRICISTKFQLFWIEISSYFCTENKQAVYMNTSIRYNWSFLNKDWILFSFCISKRKTETTEGCKKKLYYIIQPKQSSPISLNNWNNLFILKYYYILKNLIYLCYYWLLEFWLLVVFILWHC